MCILARQILVHKIQDVHLGSVPVRKTLLRNIA
jgi:hypothetical protein